MWRRFRDESMFYHTSQQLNICIACDTMEPPTCAAITTFEKQNVFVNLAN